MTRAPISLLRSMIGLAILTALDARPLDAQLPPPRELKFDRNGYSLPPGAVARLGIPPALTGFTGSIAWTADGKQFIVGDQDGVGLFDSVSGRQVQSRLSI